MTTLVKIGQPVGRVEGPDKVTGRAKYTADITLPGMLWGKCLRSPFPHARIIAIDLSRAKQLPGVYAVITAADLPDVLMGRFVRDMPLLAREKVRFIGEKVAAVAAATPEVAEEALALIDVQYEELPAVFDPLEAMGGEVPRVHDDPASYEAATERYEGAFRSAIPNVATQVFRRHGDIQAGFAQADRIFEHTFSVPNVHQGFIEPHGCLVRVEDGGKIDVWTTNKMPFAIRSDLLKALSVPEERIRVHLVPVGGDFGGKGTLMDEVLCYYLAKQTGRPVKMLMNYTEELMAGNPRHSAVIIERTGVTNDGRITARQVKAIFNNGAYFAFHPRPMLHGARAAGGCYRVPNLEIESLSVYTNTVPCGYMRGPGATQVVFAGESHIDMIAHELGLDPLEFRLRNALDEADEGPQGERWRSVPCKETLLAAAQAAHWAANKSSNVGRGIALFNRSNAAWPSNTTLSIDGKAHITLLTGVVDTGTGSHTVLQQLVAEELQVPLSAISVRVGDTDTAPYDMGVAASRVTANAGEATLAAARALKEALVQLAAQLMDSPVEQVRLEEGRFIAGDGQTRALADLMARAEDLEETPITGTGSWSSLIEPEASDVTAFAAQVAEVEVDPETGEVKLRKVVTVHDVGAVLNPLGHQGQIDGGLVMGMGQALIEQLALEDGAVTTLNLGDYKLPTMADIPDLTTVLIDDAEGGELPYKGKEIAERVNLAILAAIANAVYDAVGVRLMELPVTAEKIYKALKTRQSRTLG